MGHYTAAPLSKQRARYEQLAMRLEASLAEDDALHPNAARVRGVLDGWIAASDALREHRNKRALLSTDMAQANESWRRVMDNTYGALIIESSRQGAELFLPSRRDRNTTADSLGDDGLAEV